MEIWNKCKISLPIKFLVTFNLEYFFRSYFSIHDIYAATLYLNILVKLSDFFNPI